MLWKYYVIIDVMIYLYMRSSWSALISNNRQVASSEPVPKAWKLGKKATAFMSDSWPVNVCIHRPVRTSHSLAAASQPPDTNVFLSLLKLKLEGEREFETYLRATDITSPVWPTKAVVCWPVSISHKPHVISPLNRTIRNDLRMELVTFSMKNSWTNLEVMIWASSINLQHDR